MSLAHLAPMRLSMATQARPGGLTIVVRFSNHCFSVRYDSNIHTDPTIDIWDRGQRRVFCAVRYSLSKALPAIVQGLPRSPVYQTPEQTSFVRIEARNDGGAGEYWMFFDLKRAAAGDGYDLKMFVQSAYSPGEGQALPVNRMSKVRFSVLADKTLRGEKVKFHHKR